MHQLPFPVDAAVTDSHAQPVLTDGNIRLFGNQVVHTVHHGHIAGDMYHDVAMFVLESFLEVRQAIGPHLKRSRSGNQTKADKAGFILQDFKMPDEFLIENSSPRQFSVH